MNTLKKHSLSGAILIASCFILLAGACENSDWIDTGGQTNNVLLGFNASTTNITTGTRSIEAIEGFTGNSYTFGMSITKDNNWGSEIFPSSGDFMATMARPSQSDQWEWSFQKEGAPITPRGPEGKPLKIIAYYPVTDGTEAFSIGIPFDFTATDNPKQTEILYNTNTSYTINPAVGEGKATIPLRFQHAYSWIVISVTKYVEKSTPDDVFTLSSVAIDNLSGGWIKNKGTISPETGLAMEGSSIGPIKENRSPELLSVDTPRTYEFLVPSFMDAEVKDEDVVIALMINGKQELFPLKKEHLNQDGNAYGFRQGYINTYNLVFDNSALNLRLLNWTSESINHNFGAGQSFPTNYVKIDYTNYNNSGRPPLWTSANGYPFPTQKYTSLGIGTHKFESYLTTVNYGANGQYVSPKPITAKPPVGGIIIDDDENVALKEEVYPIFQMTTNDISIEPVPWEDENGELVAKEICRKYNGGGFHNWRLPRASELRALFIYLIYNSGNSTPMEKLDFRKDENQYKLYWTGTEVNENQAWAMYYYDESSNVTSNKRGPMISPQEKKLKFAVRCIRDM